jgi:hypothetical protein
MYTTSLSKEGISVDRADRFIKEVLFDKFSEILFNIFDLWVERRGDLLVD